MLCVTLVEHMSEFFFSLKVEEAGLFISELPLLLVEESGLCCGSKSEWE